jgi:hypothetical protein
VSTLQAIADHLAGALAPIPVSLGRGELFSNALPPRVVLVPTKDSFDGPRTAGLPRSLGTRVAGFNLCCFAADVPGAEDLVRRVAVALRMEGPTVLRVMEGEWEQAAGESELGELYRLACQVDVPLTQDATLVGEVQPTDTETDYQQEQP